MADSSPMLAEFRAWQDSTDTVNVHRLQSAGSTLAISNCELREAIIITITFSSSEYVLCNDPDNFPILVP